MVKITSMKTMGNQQVTFITLAWLAGIWDGEGTIGIYRYARIKNGKWSYCGRLTLSNTSILMIDEIVRIMNLLDIKVDIWREKKSRKINHKKAIHLTVNRIESVKKVCELLIPYLIVKKDRAELLVKFLNSRLSYKREVKRDPKTGHILGVIEQGYPQEDIKMWEEMRKLNQVGLVIDGSSETTR
jgi:hypothetical protein